MANGDYGRRNGCPTRQQDGVAARALLRGH